MSYAEANLPDRLELWEAREQNKYFSHIHHNSIPSLQTRA